jgi:hypothetical protein
MIKLLNKWHYVENETDYTACLKNEVNLIVAYVYKMNFWGLFLRLFTFGSADI